jgi:hypothetical protein
MSIGFIDKDFIEEGPFRAVFYDIQVDDPSTLSGVKLWMAYPDGSATYYMAEAQEELDDEGQTIYVFNGDTQAARLLMPDGSLETEVLNPGTSTEEVVPKLTVLPTQRKYVAEVTFELDIVSSFRSVGARAEVLVRESHSIL